MDDDATVALPRTSAGHALRPASGDDATPVGLVRPVRASRRRRSPLRRAVLSISLAMVVVLGYFLVSLYQVWSTGRGDQSAQAGSVDAIVVLGAAQYDGTPSPQLAARLDHVVELWPQGVAPIVITTGGSRPGDRFSEAEASAAYLVERGVPDDAIIQDPTGSNTVESLEAVAVELGERGVDRVLIVTDPYHALRSRLIAQDVGLTAYVSPTTTSVVRGGTSLERHLAEAGGVALGRIVGFDRL
ncbi:MAG: YdcF family protein [Ilumatobacteraceae bacterium]